MQNGVSGGDSIQVNDFPRKENHLPLNLLNLDNQMYVRSLDDSTTNYESGTYGKNNLISNNPNYYKICSKSLGDFSPKNIAIFQSNYETIYQDKKVLLHNSNKNIPIQMYTQPAQLINKQQLVNSSENLEKQQKMTNNSNFKFLNESIMNRTASLNYHKSTQAVKSNYEDFKNFVQRRLELETSL